jgi:hypothetical protein
MSEDPVTPESDPRHIDPARDRDRDRDCDCDLADLLEHGDLDIQLSEDPDPAEFREFITSVEDSNDPADPGTNAAVRIARAVLEQAESDE